MLLKIFSFAKFDNSLIFCLSLFISFDFLSCGKICNIIPIPLKITFSFLFKIFLINTLNFVSNCSEFLKYSSAEFVRLFSFKLEIPL